MSAPVLLATSVPSVAGAAPASGAIRTVPEDFHVEEILGFEPDGTGTHALLTVEKRGANTGWVAAQLARHAGVAVRDVGFSGHKDRHAVTQQAFSLPLPEAFDVVACCAWRGEGYAVIAAARHGRKLRPGSHRANRFALRVRGLQGNRAALEAGLARIAEQGVPNYFGPQRFGRGRANLQRAHAWARDDTAAPRDRAQRGFVLSAARSALFNAVLAARVRRGDWNRLLPGEAVMLDGRRSYFPAPEVDATLTARCDALDVHPSGPLPGRGPSPVTGLALEVETQGLSDGPELVDLLVRQHLDHERRALRLPVRGLAWRFEDDAALLLQFELARGAFATAVLHELLANAWDEGATGEE